MTAPTTGPYEGPEHRTTDDTEPSDGLRDDEAAERAQDRYERALGWGVD